MNLKITPTTGVLTLFKCPECSHGELQDEKDHLLCGFCQAEWNISDGIYDFREKRPKAIVEQ